MLIKSFIPIIVCTIVVSMINILYFKFPKIKHIREIRQIPKKIYMTTSIQLELVPDLLGHTADDYEVHVYNDESCRDFLQQNWGKDIVIRFDQIKNPAHKMDLWRYCMLYKCGGIYLDIKTIPVKNLKTIFTKNNTWYTCLSAVRGCYQGIIATPMKNEVILKCIHKIMNTPEDHFNLNYLLITMQMHEICKIYYDASCEVADLYTCEDKNVPDLVLFQEICKNFECRYTNIDRYRLCCNIRDKDMKHIFRTRDDQYPWKALPYGEQSILERKNIIVHSK